MKKVTVRIKFSAECLETVIMDEKDFLRQLEHFERIKNDSEPLRELLSGEIASHVNITNYEITMEDEDAS